MTMSLKFWQTFTLMRTQNDTVSYTTPWRILVYLCRLKVLCGRIYNLGGIMSLLFTFTLLFWLFLGLYSSEKRKNKQAGLKVQPKAYANDICWYYLSLIFE